MKVANKLRTLSFAAVAAGLLAASGSAFAGDNDKGMLSAGKLARDAKDFYGRTVTVSAEVEDLIDARTFTLDEDSILAGADVLVLVPAGVTATLVKDQKVVVTGKVRRYVSAEFERDFDWFKGGDIVKKGVKLDLDTRPVIIATSVRTADGREAMNMVGAMDGMSAANMPGHAGHHGAVAVDPMAASPEGILTAGKLAREGKKMYGQTVTVRAEVEDVLNNRMFTLDEDSVLSGADVVVLVPAGIVSTLSHDQVVTVTGKVRPYVVADLEKDYDWFKDGELVKTKTKVDWKTRPVLVATSIMSAGTDLMTSR